ncbi:hypothetical protein ACFT30_14465, partial [Microbacterium ureisolvens]|uniref:hypothetical protein n=1 Tax=Microbacterium ureisolvens TaxID=2781186 RepID=UPI003627CF04
MVHSQRREESLASRHDPVVARTCGGDVDPMVRMHEVGSAQAPAADTSLASGSGREGDSVEVGGKYPARHPCILPLPRRRHRKLSTPTGETSQLHRSAARRRAIAHSHAEGRECLRRLRSNEPTGRHRHPPDPPILMRRHDSTRDFPTTVLSRVLTSESTAPDHEKIPDASRRGIR